MELEEETCYHALKTHDPRFDGAFFVGVSSTGIYCRSVCTAKTPKPENCTFYPSAAAAERNGYRPCMRCRPELAPGNARVDSTARLANAALSRIEDGVLSEGGIPRLAGELGISDRHLRRVVQSEFGVSPIELAQTQRLLLAKRLLTDSDISVTDAAFASGFASLRRFNALFREEYRMSPTDLRRGHHAGGSTDALVCRLAYRPPLDWDSLLEFLKARALKGVEAVDGDTYRRTVCIKDARGWLAVRPGAHANTLLVEISRNLTRVLAPVLSRVKRLFDLSAEPMQIAERLSPLSDAHPGLRVPGAFNGFEIAVRAIIGQQVSVRGATTLAGRYAAAFGERIETPFEDLTHLTPKAIAVAEADPCVLESLGITPSRCRAILALAGAVREGTLKLRPGADTEAIIARLMALPGVGEWTAQYIAMRALAWPDAFPHTDLCLFKALNEHNPARVLEIAEQWRPWRAYATVHIWKTLEEAK